MVGAALDGEDETVVVDAERRRPLQVGDVGEPREFGDDRRDPLRRRGTVEDVGTAEQRATRLGLLVDDRDAGAGAGRGQGGDETGRPRPDDEDVDVQVRTVVVGGVGDLGELALAGDAPGHQPVEEFQGAGQQHRLGEGFLDLDEAARVLGPGRADPRGRPRRMLVPVWWMPCASSAEARVSPGCPVRVWPAKVNSSVRSRSTRPPVGMRNGWVMVVFTRPSPRRGRPS